MEGLMISRVQSGAVLGIEGYSVEVEVNLAMGISGMSIVGSINPFFEFPADTPFPDPDFLFKIPW